MTNSKMGYQTIKESKAGIYAVAAALRLVLVILFPSLPDLLTGRVEISTPVNSFKRLQEGLFLYKHNVSPYDGGVYHQAPLFLPLLSLLPDPSTYPLWTSLLYIVVDLLSADALYSIAESGEAASSRNYTSARKDSRWNGRVVAAMFLFNPFTVATCLARPTSVFSSCAILYAISQAISGRHLTSVMSLSFAAYLSMYPIFLLPPLLYLAYDRSRRWERKGQIHPPSTLVYDVLTVCGTMTILFLASYLVTGSWEFLASTYGVQISLTDLTPNGGLWWYYFVEMFDSFRAFFLGVFVLHLFSYTPALTIRLRSQPLAVLTLLLGIHAIFKPYPSIAETTLFLALLPCFRHVLPLLRYSFLAAAAILYSSCLGPAFYHLWIYAGSGNANFFYAITLVWSLGQSLLVSDLTHAILRDEFEVDRPEMRGKEIRQI